MQNQLLHIPNTHPLAQEFLLTTNPTNEFIYFTENLLKSYAVSIFEQKENQHFVSNSNINCTVI